jgi:magnesium transporter
MITKHTFGKITWVDVVSPTEDEVHDLMEKYSIHPHIAEELLLPTLEPKVEFYDDQFIYLILHFPALKHTHSKEQKEQEVDFIIGDNVLITTRYDTIDPLYKLSKVLEVDSVLRRGGDDANGGLLFYYMIRKLYSSLGHELASIKDEVRKIEKNIFEGQEKAMVRGISGVSTDLLEFKQAIQLHRPVLETFEVIGTQLFGANYSYRMKTVLGEYKRLNSHINSHVDAVSELRQTNDSILSTKQNEVMKVLTIMAFVTFPLSLLASIFGMNTLETPIIGIEKDFWIIIGIMVVAALFFFVFFKYKKWL